MLDARRSNQHMHPLAIAYVARKRAEGMSMRGGAALPQTAHSADRVQDDAPRGAGTAGDMLLT